MSKGPGTGGSDAPSGQRVLTALGYLLFPYVMAVGFRSVDAAASASPFRRNGAFIAAVVVPSGLLDIAASKIGWGLSVAVYYAGALLLLITRAIFATRWSASVPWTGDYSTWFRRIVYLCAALGVAAFVTVSVAGPISDALSTAEPASVEGRGSSSAPFTVTKSGIYAASLTVSAFGSCRFTSVMLEQNGSIVGSRPGPTAVQPGTDRVFQVFEAGTMSSGDWMVVVDSSLSCGWHLEIRPLS